MLDGQNFSLVAGDTLLLDGTITDDSGAPLDLTAAEVRVTWALFAPTGPALVTKTIGAGIAIPGIGAIEITLDGPDTAGLPPGFYHHEAVMTDGLGEVSTLWRGSGVLLPRRVVLLH